MRSLLRFVSCWVVLIAGYLPCHAAGNPSLSNRDSLRPRFRIPLPPTLSQHTPGSLLSLHAVHDGDTLESAVAADYSRGAQSLEMELLTELRQGAHYVLRWRNESGAASAGYRTPEPVASLPAQIIRRYPQSDTVPANLLFIQFRFDAPMRPDADVWNRIHIREDVDGSQEIPFAWRQRCFWLDSDRVLQLMIHPGRVKSGIHYGGPLLVKGHRYEIRIDSGLTDARGNSLPAQQTQHIVAAVEDHDIPLLVSYSGNLAPGSREPLQLRFSEEMDCSGLLTGIRVFDDDESPLNVQLEIAADGRSCSVIPAAAWPRGKCSFQLDAEIRDLGANTLRRRFEIRHVREAANDKIPLRYSVKLR